jgi:hypothetical protein
VCGQVPRRADVLRSLQQPRLGTLAVAAGAPPPALRAEPDVLIVSATFVLALVAGSGFLTVGVVALVGDGFGGDGGEYGLLLGIAGVAEVFGALALVRLPLRNLALTAVLAWALLGAFRFPLGLAETPVVAAVLLAMTGFASALTDIPLIALVQQRIPDRHLAKALGLCEAGIAGAIAVAPFVAAATIEHAGVRNAFMLSGAALIGLAAIAAVALTRVTPAPVRRASAFEARAVLSRATAPRSGLEDVAG